MERIRMLALLSSVALCLILFASGCVVVTNENESTLDGMHKIDQTGKMSSFNYLSHPIPSGMSDVVFLTPTGYWDRVGYVYKKSNNYTYTIIANPPRIKNIINYISVGGSEDE